jgi:hypothetical protein
MDRQGKLAHPGSNLVQAGGRRAGEHVLVVVDGPLVEDGSQLAAAIRDAGAQCGSSFWAGEPRRRRHQHDRAQHGSYGGDNAAIHVDCISRRLKSGWTGGR